MKKIEWEQYEAARLMMPEKAAQRITNVTFLPVFLAPGIFVYKNEVWIEKEKGYRYIEVNGYTGNKRDLFDHEKLAKLLSERIGNEVDADKIEISELSREDDWLCFRFQGVMYRYQPDILEKVEDDFPAGYCVSPDKKWAAFTEEHNLFLVDLITGKKNQLTYDGVKHCDYAGRSEGDTGFIRDKLIGLKLPARVLWSPDSRHFITYRLDQRNVGEMHLIQSLPKDRSLRPQLHTYKYSLPGDDNVPMVEYYLGDVSEATLKKVELPKVTSSFMTPINGLIESVGWSDQGKSIALFTISRDFKRVDVYRVNPNTGKAKHLFYEETDTFLFFDLFRLLHNEDTEYQDGHKTPFWYLDDFDTLFWLSQRDGRYHLYEYDAENGQLRKQITVGDFDVRRVLNIDLQKKKIYLSISGEAFGGNPYDMHPYVVDLGTGGMKALSTVKGNHIIHFAPDGGFYLDSINCNCTTQQTVLSHIDGTTVGTVCSADISHLEKAVFVEPIEFNFAGEDGVTPIYGMLFLPKQQYKNQSIPLIDYYYGGPQTCNVPRTLNSLLSKGFVESLVQIGFACVIIDGRGTPMRGKAFHDHCYRNLGACAGIEDHVAIIRQLCEKYPIIDKDKVGVWGHSGGGYAALHCMVDHPELYKCAVSSGGNHVQEIYLADWSERFMGMFESHLWERQNAEFRVDHLAGKLLLIHGELDDNVHPANTMRVINALIQANKDFELLIMPNKHHTMRDDPYYRRRILDFFVKNLLNASPPDGFNMA